MKKDTHNLFVYGTLTDLRLLKTITGKEFEGEPAELPGYRKVDPPYSYPLLLPDPRFKVNGLLLKNVDTEAIQRLDRYEDEGETYKRCKVKVRVKTRKTEVEAFVYFGEPHKLLRSSDLRKWVDKE